MIICALLHRSAHAFLYRVQDFLLPSQGSFSVHSRRGSMHGFYALRLYSAVCTADSAVSINQFETCLTASPPGRSQRLQRGNTGHHALA